MCKMVISHRLDVNNADESAQCSGTNDLHDGFVVRRVPQHWTSNEAKQILFGAVHTMSDGKDDVTSFIYRISNTDTFLGTCSEWLLAKDVIAQRCTC